MGYAHGELMTEKAQGLMNSVWAYLEEQVVSIHSQPYYIYIFLFHALLSSPLCCLTQEQAINGTVDIFPKWFLKDVADLG